MSAPMAQRLEHRSDKAGVDGSIPSGSTNKKTISKIIVFYYLLLPLKLIIYINISICGVPILGLVSQLVRALRRHRRGLQFESARAHIKYSIICLTTYLPKRVHLRIKKRNTQWFPNGLRKKI